jgi:amidophosphoribosyltransferase
VDIPTSGELLAATYDLEASRKYLGVEILFYQQLEDLIEAVTRKGKHHIDSPCHACLGGPYIKRNAV